MTLFDCEEHFSVLVNELKKFSLYLCGAAQLFADLLHQKVIVYLHVKCAQWVMQAIAVHLSLDLQLDLLLDAQMVIGIPLEEGKQEWVH